MSTPDSPEADDPRTYDGPDSDIAAGNITDADFTTNAPEGKSPEDEADADADVDADADADGGA